MFGEEDMDQLDHQDSQKGKSNLVLPKVIITSSQEQQYGGHAP